MSERIRIRKAGGTWTVRAGGAVLAESKEALELAENGRDPVIYFPRDDIAMAFLDKSDRQSHCPHKGEASYFSIQTRSTVLKDAGWSYETPVAAAEPIAGHIAFDPELVTVEEI